MINKNEEFLQECLDRVRTYPEKDIARVAKQFVAASTIPKYSYNFTWLSRPIIQYPQDMVAMQELIWKIRPDLIIETGIAHGGSLILSASMLAMMDYCDAVEAGVSLDPSKSSRRVLGLDIDIREHNKTAIEQHPLSHMIEMIEGSSIDVSIVEKVKNIAKKYTKVLVCLDSNHTHDHVLAELQAYAPLTSRGSYCVVFDTLIEELPQSMYPDRSWGPGNNPKTAVFKYIEKLKEGTVLAIDGKPLIFEIDKDIESKILISVAPDGYLRRVD